MPFKICDFETNSGDSKILERYHLTSDTVQISNYQLQNNLLWSNSKFTFQLIVKIDQPNTVEKI